MRRGVVACLVGAAATLLLGGCNPVIPGGDPADIPPDSGDALSAGSNVVQLDTEGVNVFRFATSADRAVRIEAQPITPAILGIGFLDTPDFRRFQAFPGADLRSSDGDFHISPTGDGDLVGVEVLGESKAAGVWRFSLVAQPRIADDDVAAFLQSQGLLGRVLGRLYFNSGQPVLSGRQADFWYSVLPGLLDLSSPLDVVINVEAAPRDVGVDDPTDPNEPGEPDFTPTDAPVRFGLDEIARTGDSVPGVSGASFTWFGNPIIDDDGRVAFFASFDGGRGTGGVFIWEDGQLQTILINDETDTGVVPGRDDAVFGPLDVQWDTGSFHLAWAREGRLLISMTLNEQLQPNALLRWRASDGDLLLVADELDLEAELGDAMDSIPAVYHPGASDRGVAYYSNRYSFFRSDGSFALFQQDFFRSDGIDSDLIADGAVPGQPLAASFAQKDVMITSHNAGGTWLFQAPYENGEGDHGVYTYRNGEIRRILDNGANRTFAGLPSGARVGAEGEPFDALSIGPAGHIVVETTLTTGGGTRETVLHFDTQRWRELRDPANNVANALLAGVNRVGETLILVEDRPYFTTGTVATQLNTTARLPAEIRAIDPVWLSFGGAINNNGRGVLRYNHGDENGGGLAYWDGEQVQLVFDSSDAFARELLPTIDAIFPREALGPTEVDRVGTIATRPEVNRTGMSGFINDTDQIVFRVGYLGDDGREETADDVQVIVIAEGIRE